MRVLVAPDSFKGTFTAHEVTGAIRAGLEDLGIDVDACPLADGGEGTLDVLLDACGGRRAAVGCHDPLGRPITASFGLAGDGTAIVEAAAAAGLPLVAPHERDAEGASSYGVGELLVAAARAGAGRIVLAVGGVACTEGGVGAAEAIRAAGGLGAATLTVISDVDTPFERAAEVYGPQKGADPAAVRRLTARLHALAERLPRDPRGVRYTGAAGGLAGGLWARFDAELVPGAEFVLRACRIPERLAVCDAVITGEGRLDEQSFYGKLIGTLVGVAAAAGVPVHVLAGQVALSGERVAACGLASAGAAGSLPALRTAARRLGRTFSRRNRS